MQFRQYAHNLGLTFGAADNDLLHFSDGHCCCSGADILLQRATFFQFNYIEAVKRGISSKEIRLENIEGMWRPLRSISMYINSRSRLPPSLSGTSDMERYLRAGWNGRVSGFVPPSSTESPGLRFILRWGREIRIQHPPCWVYCKPAAVAAHGTRTSCLLLMRKNILLLEFLNAA